MDEHSRTDTLEKSGGADGRTERKKRPGRRIWLRVIPFAAVLAVAAVIALTGIVGGEISINGFRRAAVILTGRAAREIEVREGYGRAFADLGICVVSAGEMGALLIGPDGREEAREMIALPSPVIADNGKVAAVYSSGGRDVLIIDNNGARARIRVDAEIRGVSVSRGGIVAVSTGAYGRYRGAVMAYRQRGGEYQRIYEWYSGADYVLGAAVSADGKTLAALALGESGGRIAFYGMGDTQLQAEATYPHAILEIAYMRDGTLLARTRDKLLTVAADGGITELFDCGAYDTLAYTTGDGAFAAMYVVSRTGDGRLITVDTSGRVNETERYFGRVVSLRSRDGYTALLTEDGLYVFRDRTLARYTEFQDASMFTDAFPRGDAAAFAAGVRMWKLFN